MHTASKILVRIEQFIGGGSSKSKSLEVPARGRCGKCPMSCSPSGGIWIILGLRVRGRGRIIIIIVALWTIAVKGSH